MLLLSDYIRTIPDYPVEGVNFYDLNSLCAGPIFNQVVDELAKLVSRNSNITHIVGVESRGFTFGAPVAYALDLPFVMVRKKGAKYPGELLEQSYDLEYGSATLTLQTGLLGHTDRCVIVDDLVATGGSVLATKQLIQQTGASVECVAAVVDLSYLHSEQLFGTRVLSVMDVRQGEKVEKMSEPYKKISDNQWLVTVQENGKDKELYIEFPPDCLDQVGWSEGTELLWNENEDGSWSISKK